jgi:hypothetical protein
MYMLERAGIECHHVDRSGVDLWCQSNNNDMFTLQVKAANPSKITEDRSLTRYYYNLRTPKLADFYMFIALDIQKVIIMGANELGRRTGMNLNPNKFTGEAEQEGLYTLQNFKRGDPHLTQ